MIEPSGLERAEGGGGGIWIFNHLPTILWHRRLYIIVPFVALLIAGLITAYALPTLYRSSATMLVESPALPTEVTQAPAGGNVEERIAKIREQVLSRGDLISLIEQHELYPEERRSQPMSLVVDKMRQATMVGALANDIGQGGGAGGNVIAINMSFDYPDPAKAQAVMQAYVTKFLRMDSEQIEDQANLSVRFLQEQAASLQRQIQDIETQIRNIKSSHGAVLAGGAGGAFLDTGSYTAQIASLENQNRQLALQARTGGGNPQLAQAESELAALRARYSDSHPDVVQARERIQLLKSMPVDPGSGTAAVIQEQIRANNVSIAQLTAAKNAALARANAAAAGQARAPAILEQAAQLDSRANTLRSQYSEVATRLLRAQSSARLANEQRGERLSLVEPPNLPDSPQWPNRPLVIGAGAVAGLGLGLILALLVELLNRPMRSPAQLQGMGLPVLGVVPILQTNVRRKRFAFFRRKAPQVA